LWASGASAFSATGLHLLDLFGELFFHKSTHSLKLIFSKDTAQLLFIFSVNIGHALVQPEKLTPYVTRLIPVKVIYIVKPIELLREVFELSPDLIHLNIRVPENLIDLALLLFGGANLYTEALFILFARPLKVSRTAGGRAETAPLWGA